MISAAVSVTAGAIHIIANTAILSAAYWAGMTELADGSPLAPEMAFTGAILTGAEVLAEVG